jgi:hypothetical protein
MNMSLVAPSVGDVADEKRPSHRLQISWVTVVVFAVALAYVDGFWTTSVLRAIGATASSQEPFQRWLRDSTMMLAPLAVAVFAALLLTRRLVRRGRRELVQLAVAAALILAFSTVVSIAEVATTTAQDYSTQTTLLAHPHTNHFTTPAVPANATVANTSGCTLLCAAKHDVLVVHVRAVAYGSVALLVTNLLLVLWLLAIRGGRLWTRRVAPGPRLDESDGQTSVGAALV